MKTRKLVDEFLMSLRAKGDRKCTLTWYGSLIGHLAKTYKDLPESVGALEGFLGSLNINLESRRSTIRALRVFYSWAGSRYHIFNPMLQIKMPYHRRQTIYYLSATELAILCALPMSPRDRCLLLLLVDTGVRIGEALNLTRDDILEEVILVSGKTGEREVPVSAEVRDQLLQLRTSGYLFQGTKGRLGQTGAYHIVKKAFQRAGIHAKKWGAHTLRHTFGRQYILAGGDLVSLQRILGHANISTTRIYADLDMRDITLQHTRFTPLHSALAGAQGLLFTRGNSSIPVVSKN